MGLATKLTSYTHGDIDLIKGRLLEDGFDIAYGSTYSIEEIHKAILDGFPAIVSLQGRSTLVVGENPRSLIVKSDGQDYETSDDDLKKFWTGKAIIVMDKEEKEVSAECCKSDMVIFAHDRDTWSFEKTNTKVQAKAKISRIKKIPAQALPPHPVIVIFKEGTDEDIKEKVRSYILGAEIYIVDSSDPVTEFLHELGHVYWSTRLTKDDKKKFKTLHKQLNEKNLPSIFVGMWSWKNPEEMFSTLYIWYAQGIISHEGYHKILEAQCPIGYNLLMNVFGRIAEEELILNIWNSKEKQIDKTINSYLGKAKPVKVNGKLIRIKQLNKADNIRFPRQIEHESCGCFKGREWIIVKAGLMSGNVLVLDDKGYIDFDFMKANVKRAGLVPDKKLIKSKRRNYMRTVWVKPEKVQKVINLEPKDFVDKIELKKSEIAKIRKVGGWEKLKSIFKVN